MDDDPISSVSFYLTLHFCRRILNFHKTLRTDRKILQIEVEKWDAVAITNAVPVVMLQISSSVAEGSSTITGR